jgi:hypothetical protein
LGGLGAIAPLLLLSAGIAGAIAPLLLLSAGIAGAAAGAAGGGALSEQAASRTAAAARALRASFVFIDESPNLYEITVLIDRVQTSWSGAGGPRTMNSIDSPAHFKLPRCTRSR